MNVIRRIMGNRILVVVLMLLLMNAVHEVQKVGSTNGIQPAEGTKQVVAHASSENAQNMEEKSKTTKMLNQNLKLVNKENRLNEGECPNDLKVPDVRFIPNGDPQVKKMQREAAEALEKLFTAAEDENVVLLGVSGYRDYSYQKSLYDNDVLKNGKEKADRYVAEPGASEHQTGLAMDVLSNECKSLDESFANTESYKWLKENSYKHGFIIRYPKGKENVTGYGYEPWHVRYVGIEAAKEIHEKGITLEEYLKASDSKK